MRKAAHSNEDSLEFGKKILCGIVNDHLYIVTHPDHKDEVETGRRKMKYDIKDKFVMRNR